MVAVINECAYQLEWVTESGVSQELTEKWVKPIDNAVEIAKLLNWKYYNHEKGWYINSCDPSTGMRENYGQFKPKTPIIYPDSEKAQKYITFPKGSTTEAIYAVMTLNEWLKISDRYGIEILDSDIDETRDDLGFWAWVIKHREIPITITEGAKKAGCLLSNGVVTIALTGVWNGQTGKGSDLKGSLNSFIVPGRPIYLGFDGDVVVKESVEKALIQFGRLCKKAKAEVLIMQWDLTLGKGIDDVVVNQGTEALETIINEAISYGNWLKGLKSDQKEPEKSQTNKYKRIPKADVIGMQITENHRDRLIYCDELSSWLAYEIDGETGIWEMISKDIMLSIIDRIVESQGIRGYGSSSYIENIEKKMRRLLVCKHWEEKNDKHLPFENGVLDLETGKFHQHAPGFRLTSKLPRQYNLLATSWSKTDQWLTEVVKGDEKAKELLLCYLAAVLRGRHDLQVFCYLIGSGGSGKSTFTNLLTQLVGEQNTVELDFDELDDKHEVIRLFGKRLLILADQDRVGRKIANFKKLTGGDRLSGRYLFKNSMSFQFKGMACVTSNPPNVFPASTAKWLLRRMRLVEFNGRFQPNYRLMEELEPELPGLTNYLLNIPEHHLENILKGRSKELTATTWEHQCRSDGLASWINDWLIQDEKAFSIIGSNGREWADSEYNASSSTLYGSYVLYCKQTGRTPKTTQNFSADLIEVTERILGWQVSKGRKRIAGKMVRGIEGIRLRTNDDDEQLLVEDTLYNRDNCDKQQEAVTTESDRLEFPIDLGCDNFDHLITNEQQNELEKSLVALSVKPQNDIESNGEKVVTPNISSTVQTETGLTENQSVVTAKNGSEGLSQIDYSTFPHLTSNNLLAKEKRAISIKKRMLASSDKVQLAQLKELAGYSPHEINWVWKHSLTPTEKTQIKEAANTIQRDIFDGETHDWQEVIQGIDLELVRLGWTTEQGQQYIKEKYGKHSRQLLDDHQLLSFWQDLQRMTLTDNQLDG